jgi:hypothetical protein
LAIAKSTVGAGVIGLSVGDIAEDEVMNAFFFPTSFSGLLRKLSGRSKPVIHYPVFIPIKSRKKTAKLACLNYDYPFLLCNQCYFQQDVKCLSRQRRQKCLLAFLSETTKDRV